MQLVFALSRYKFAAKMVCGDNNVLELGCGEGIGTPFLSEFSAGYTGVDADTSALETARRNWGFGPCRFIESEFLGKRFGEFDSVVSLDVIENIHPPHEALFFETIERNLGGDGVCMIGTLNVSASVHHSEAGNPGKVNWYDADRLKEAMNRIFHNVFIFGMNDEVLHTGFSPMAHYLFALGCYKKVPTRGT